MADNNIKVSIVIPVYNVELYVENCLTSVFMQTYRNLEVVLVDDCGTDQSMNLVQQFLEQHPALQAKVIKHACNRGLSAARNTGLSAATGDYVLFLDSDDRLSEDAVEALVQPLETDSYEVVIGGYQADLGNSLVAGRCLKLSEGPILGNEAIFGAYAEGLWYVMAWNKLCHRQFLLDNQLFFTEGLLHEDVIWTFKLACKLESMFIVKKATYIYLLRNASIMTSMSVEKDVRIYLQAFDEIIHFLRQENRIYGILEYRVIEGKKTGILYSLLQKGEKQLYNKFYPEFYRRCYLSPWKAFRKGVIDVKYLIRDLHYCLPMSFGRVYKRMFYQLFYEMRGIKIDGNLW